MESNLQSKLQAYSPAPPEGVWDKIADFLDADEGYVQRLSQYEAEPPAGLWSQIEKNIAPESTPAKVVPFPRRFKKPLRYIAAASLIAVTLVTITLSLRRTEAGALQAGSQTTVPEQAPSAEKSMAPFTASSAPPTENNRSFPKQERSDNSGKTVLASAGQKNTTAGFRSAGVYSSLNHYVTFTDGDGQLRRVSKKLANMVNCKEDDGSCQQRLKQLRQKMAANAMTTDFTGILEMLRQLQ